MHGNAQRLTLAVLLLATALVSTSRAADDTASGKNERTLKVKSVDSKANQIVVITSTGKKKAEETETLQLTGKTKIGWLFDPNKAASLDDIKPKDMIKVVMANDKVTLVQLYKSPDKKK